VLIGVRKGKYASRFIAQAITEDGRDVASLSLEAGLARPYDDRAKTSWCE
jgi:hypothetical protein